MIKMDYLEKFSNKVVRQGNSLCVRIPSKIVKKLKIEENKEVLVKIGTLEMAELDPNIIEKYLELIKPIKKLKKHDRTKLLLLISLNFYCGKHIKENWDTQENLEKALNKVNSYIVKQYGKKILEEYNEFNLLAGKQVDKISQ